VSGSYTCIGTVRQAGARRYDEALANLRLIARAPTMLRLLRAVSQVLDMSDPDHEAFVDSAADCLDALRQQQRLCSLLATRRCRGCPSSKHLAQIWRGGNGEQASSGVCF
jgi:hypothetical protein